MKTLLTIFTFFFLCAGITKATEQIDSTEVLEERMDLFEKIVNLQVRLDMIQTSGFWNKNKEINSMSLVDTLWRKGWDSSTEEDQMLVRESLKEIQFDKFEMADKVRLFLMDQKLGKVLVFNSKFMSDIYDVAKSGDLTRRAIYTLLNYEDELKEAGFGSIFKEVYENYGEDLAPYMHAKAGIEKHPMKNVLQDVVFHQKELGDYGSGEYRFGPKLFMFCRHDRDYPCMMFMKDSRNQLVKNDNGRIWTHRALGSARKGRMYNVKNGFTPAGIYTIDSVMPEANKQKVYGKYRRLKLNFIPRSESESRHKELMPESSFGDNWWKQAVVARDIGRNLLRIHGTGLKNNDPSSAHYPFVKTSGCIAMRENKYDGVKYKDQRVLLDQLMKYSGFTPRYRNESKLKALLYVIEINGDKKPVEKIDIEELLDLR